MIKKRNIDYARVFGFLREEQEEKLKRIILIRIILLTCFFGIIWSTFYLILGLYAGACTVGGYAFVSLLNLFVYYFRKEYKSFRFIQLVLILMLPFSTQLALGGFDAGSGVIMSSMLCPLGALMFHNGNSARKFFYAYIVAVCVAGVLEIIFPTIDSGVNPFIRKVFFILNFVVNGFIIYALLDYFMKQKELFRMLLEERNRDVLDSIQYAKRLQLAILPSKDELNSNMKNGFVLFLPKDVVSGDFYWMQKTQNKIFLAVADCTGHGVPGAMVSVVCSNALNRSVNEFGIDRPGQILDKSREIVINTFARSGSNVKDGMDIALCEIPIFENDSNYISFSGANNPLWIVRRKDLLTDEDLNRRGTMVVGNVGLIEFKGDKQPIGLHSNMNDFTEVKIKTFQGDSVYIFTDGFADQFGGDKGKKFKYKPFKEFLISINSFNMNQQKEQIQKTFEFWKGDIEQVDDVCIIGFKL